MANSSLLTLFEAEMRGFGRGMQERMPSLFNARCIVRTDTFWPPFCCEKSSQTSFMLRRRDLFSLSSVVVSFVVLLLVKIRGRPVRFAGEFFFVPELGKRLLASIL